jgi:two-component system KDP operon response regulator KdpE
LRRGYYLKKKIVVVDDEPDIRQGLISLLKSDGYDVSEAQDGDEFVKSLKKGVPDLVILDIMMPGMTTHEIIEAIKGKRSIRVIILTALRTNENEIEALKRYPQVVDYMEKPIDNEDFLAAVKRHLK